MLDTLTFRAARLDELPEIASFWIAMFEEVGIQRESDFDPDWRERFVEYFARRIASGEAQYFVATDGEKLVGTAGAMLADGYPVAIHGRRFGYVFGVRVDPEYRGRGLATSLTEATIAYLKQKNCARIRLHASPFGLPIYQRLGFVPTNEMQLAHADAD